MVVVSDTSVLIDLERASLLTPVSAFASTSPYPTCSTERELKSFGGPNWSRRIRQ